jgi:hypothetical protein
MSNLDFQGFCEALPKAAQIADNDDLSNQFRHHFRKEIVSLFTMLRSLGLWGGATQLHPNPPTDCDLCGEKLKVCRMFVDGTTVEGAWANMCPKCFMIKGDAIGWGKGQLYLNVGNGEWRLVSGGNPEMRECDDLGGVVG